MKELLFYVDSAHSFIHSPDLGLVLDFSQAYVFNIPIVAFSKSVGFSSYCQLSLPPGIKAHIHVIFLPLLPNESLSRRKHSPSVSSAD
jgi:hypothetical protein